MGNTAVNIGVHLFVGSYVFTELGYILSIGIAGSHSDSV